MAAQSTPENANRVRQRGALLERVLSANAELLRRDATRRSCCSADADAAFSEACCDFLSYFQGAEDSEHALRWLRIAVKHSALRHRQAQIREVPSAYVEQSGGTPVMTQRGLAQAVDHEDRERLRLLAALKPDQRVALLDLAAGYTYAEIAERRGWTYTKVNRCLAEGRAALRQMEGGERIERPDT